MKRKILDVVMECIEKGIDSKTVLDKLRTEGNLIEPKRSNNVSFEEPREEKPEMSLAEWTRHEEVYYSKKYDY